MKQATKFQRCLFFHGNLSVVDQEDEKWLEVFLADEGSDGQSGRHELLTPDLARSMGLAMIQWATENGSALEPPKKKKHWTQTRQAQDWEITAQEKMELKTTEPRLVELPSVVGDSTHLSVHLKNRKRAIVIESSECPVLICGKFMTESEFPAMCHRTDTVDFRPARGQPVRFMMRGEDVESF